MAVALAVLTVATPRDMEFSRFLAVPPALAAALWPVRATLVLGLTMLVGVGCYLLVDSSSSYVYTAGALAAVTAAAAYASYVRQRREHTLREVRAVANAAQAVLLRPIPERVGTLRIDSLYRSAAPQAQVGGDFFALADTAYGIRLILGDVRGKGLPALAVTGALLGCFREAAYDAPDLATLSRRLDAALARESDGADGDALERFATAVLVEFSRDGDGAVLLNRGHPAPLLTTSAGTTVLDTPAAGPPLNLAGPQPRPARPLRRPRRGPAPALHGRRLGDPRPGRRVLPADRVGGRSSPGDHVRPAPRAAPAQREQPHRRHRGSRRPPGIAVRRE
ncbi:PP2C family protein-serine/threonine phosphatase [Streptacidiphilus fuscans]